MREVEEDEGSMTLLTTFTNVIRFALYGKRSEKRRGKKQERKGENMAKAWCWCKVQLTLGSEKVD